VIGGLRVDGAKERRTDFRCFYDGITLMVRVEGIGSSRRGGMW
jgi:hypothetical protein